MLTSSLLFTLFKFDKCYKSAKIDAKSDKKGEITVDTAVLLLYAEILNQDVETFKNKDSYI